MENQEGGNQGESYENNDEYGYNQDVLSFPHPDDKCAEFMRTEPPTFSSTTYPLEDEDLKDRYGEPERGGVNGSR
jgi:hypothetical protein